MAFNKLSPDQTERLALLIEECGEVIQAATKILRHGYEDKKGPLSPRNREVLASEIGDVLVIIGLLEESEDLDAETITVAKAQKYYRFSQYLRHQPNSLIHALKYRLKVL